MLIAVVRAYQLKIDSNNSMNDNDDNYNNSNKDNGPISNSIPVQLARQCRKRVARLEHFCGEVPVVTHVVWY